MITPSQLTGWREGAEHLRESLRHVMLGIDELTPETAQHCTAECAQALSEVSRAAQLLANAVRAEGPQ